LSVERYNLIRVKPLLNGYRFQDFKC